MKHSLYYRDATAVHLHALRSHFQKQHGMRLTVNQVIRQAIEELHRHLCPSDATQGATNGH